MLGIEINNERVSARSGLSNPVPLAIVLTLDSIFYGSCG